MLPVGFGTSTVLQPQTNGTTHPQASAATPSLSNSASAAQTGLNAPSFAAMANAQSLAAAQQQNPPATAPYNVPAGIVSTQGFSNLLLEVDPDGRVNMDQLKKYAQDHFEVDPATGVLKTDATGEFILKSGVDHTGLQNYTKEFRVLYDSFYAAAHYNVEGRHQLIKDPNNAGQAPQDKSKLLTVSYDEIEQLFAADGNAGSLTLADMKESFRFNHSDFEAFLKEIMAQKNTTDRGTSFTKSDIDKILNYYFEEPSFPGVPTPWSSLSPEEKQAKLPAIQLLQHFSDAWETLGLDSAKGYNTAELSTAVFGNPLTLDNGATLNYRGASWQFFTDEPTVKVLNAVAGQDPTKALEYQHRVGAGTMPASPSR